MSKKPLVIQRFDGGWSTDSKIGTSHSFAYSRHIDFRKSPTQLTVLPETVKESSTTVTGLITEMLQLPSGKIVAIDDAGGVYTRTTGGTWAKDGTTLTDTAMGMSYNEQQDTIWIPGLTTMHSITDADEVFSGGSFTVNDNAITSVIDQSSSNGHANTYTVTGSISESATDRLLVTPTLEPAYSIKLWVTAKNTSDITVTMHDSQNNVLGTSTLTNANLTDGAYNEFVFTSPVRTTKGTNGATYHYHVTYVTGTAPTIGTSTSSDFATADYQTYANRLVSPRNAMHPVKDFLQYTCIGNERYLAVWEIISQSAPASTEFLQHRLTFPPGYEVTSLSVWTEYLAIACEKRATSAANEFQSGKIFFWDGISATYNFVIDVPEGAPYGAYSKNNILYYYASGSLYGWSGGNPVKVRQMPNTDTEYTDTNAYFINYPNTMAARNGILLTAFPSITTSTTVEHGVYSYGSRDRHTNDGFGYSYTISTATRTNGTLRLGCLKNYGSKLLLSWRDSSSYGVDIVDASSDPFGEATWESLISDDGRPDKEKEAGELIIDFEALPSNVTVTPKYKINRGNWVTGTAATSGDTQSRMNINKRYKEIQFGFNVSATSATATPVVYGINLIRETNAMERD